MGKWLLCCRGGSIRVMPVSNRLKPPFTLYDRVTASSQHYPQSSLRFAHSFRQQAFPRDARSTFLARSKSSVSNLARCSSRGDVYVPLLRPIRQRRITGTGTSSSLARSARLATLPPRKMQNLHCAWNATAYSFGDKEPFSIIFRGEKFALSPLVS